MRPTAAGSLPGKDFRGALGFVLELFSHLVPLPELPDRGPGSEIVGRSAALLADTPVELSAQGWRIADHPGVDARRAIASWRRDLDDAEELLQGFGGTIKIAVAGPWTLAASLGRARGDVVLADRGARRDVAQALQAGISELLAECRRRLPEVSVVLQIDEPVLPVVLSGGVATASGYGRLRAIERAEAVEHLRPFAPGATLHCCAPGDWLSVAKQAGFEAVHLDFTAPDHDTLDSVASWIDDGRTVVVGLLDAARVNEVPVPDALVKATLALVDRLAVEPSVADDRLMLAPSCGLATWRRAEAAAALRTLVRASDLATGELLGSRR